MDEPARPPRDDHHDGDGVGDDAQREGMSDATSHLLEEARMLLPGFQALFGFQLIAVFSQAFRERLPEPERWLHYGATALSALGVALLLAPAAYHRLSEPLEISRGFLRWSGRSLAVALAPLALAMAIDLHVVGVAVIGARAVPAVVAVAVLAACVAIWFALPLRKRHEHRSRRRERLSWV